MRVRNEKLVTLHVQASAPTGIGCCSTLLYPSISHGFETFEIITNNKRFKTIVKLTSESNTCALDSRICRTIAKHTGDWHRHSRSNGCNRLLPLQGYHLKKNFSFIQTQSKIQLTMNWKFHLLVPTSHALK